MSIEIAEKLASLLKQHELHEIHYHYQDLEITIKKSPPLHHSSLSSLAPSYSPIEAPVSQCIEQKSQNHDEALPIRSPMIGTFYRATEPTAAPLAQEGQILKKGDPIGLIEAMKVLTLVYAPQNGMVKKFLVENSEYVECDQILCSFEPQKT